MGILAGSVGGRRAIAALLTASVARVASAQSDDDLPEGVRPGDQVFFGLYGGLTYPTVRRYSHLADDLSRSELDDPQTGRSWIGGYSVAFWPREYIGLEACFEVMDLNLRAGSARYDRCVTAEGDACLPPRTSGYGALVGQFGPTLRGGIPLRYVQLNAGTGIMHSVLLQRTQDPLTRLDETSFESGVSLRLAGGLNGYLSRDWRGLLDYRMDYRFLPIHGSGEVDAGDEKVPTLLENRGLVVHSLVMGVSVSPEGFKESPDKAELVVLPFLPVAVGWTVATIVRALL